MTSDEIKKERLGCDGQNVYLEAWFREIALQLALIQERLPQVIQHVTISPLADPEEGKKDAQFSAAEVAMERDACASIVEASTAVHRSGSTVYACNCRTCNWAKRIVATIRARGAREPLNPKTEEVGS